MGRLHTCYAPVRRSPSNQASLINAAPRLACVKPIASVHPEPGSNSSLLYFLASFAFLSSLTVRFFLSLILHFVVSSFQRSLVLRLRMKFLSFPSARSRLYFLSKRTAKLCTFFELTKFLSKIFSFSFSVPFWPYSHNCSQLRMQRYCYFWYLQIISILFFELFFICLIWCNI